MALTPEELVRFSCLRANFISAEQMKDIIGVYPRETITWGKYMQYTRMFKKRIAEKEGLVSRFAFENYLQHDKLLPFRSAALQLGMEEESLKITIESLCLNGIEDINAFPLPPDLIKEDFIRNIYRYFPSLNGVIFSDHSDYCQQLHEAIKQVLGVKIAPQYCTTSLNRLDNPPDIANSLCAISHQPTSIRYEVMMDFGKPFSLPPDTCSRLLVETERAVLLEFVLGSL